jgi:uncharacterized protein YecT (DUF1311 family)
MTLNAPRPTLFIPNVMPRHMMSFAAALAATTLFPLASSPASAATKPQAESTEFSRCMKASGGVTADMKACLHTEYNRLDRELNATYKSVMRQLKTQHLRSRLVESQRVWIWRRDGDCRRKADASGFKGGTAADLIHDDCLVTTVRKRIGWLKKVPANPGYLTKV